MDVSFLPEKVILISNGKTSHYFRGTSLPCNNSVASLLSSNKYFLRKLLREKNIPAPQTIALRHTAAWRSILQSTTLRFPLVVKPIGSSHANGATMNITTPAELHRAVDRAFNYMKRAKEGDRALVEEFFSGHDLRLLVVGNKVVSVVKREPAYVVGDGTSTIRQLIHAFNDQWRSPLKYDFPLCPIPLDSEVTRYLSRQNVTIDSVLLDGEKMQLRWNANVSTGGRPIDVTNIVHPRIKNLALQVTKLSHLKVGGVDILCKDITSHDVSVANVSVLEINDAPGLDIHHFPYEGKGQNVTREILDYIFRKTTSSKNPTDEQIQQLLDTVYISPEIPPAIHTYPKRSQEDHIAE